MVQQRAPSKAIVMSGSLSVGSCSRLEATVFIQGVVEILRGPWGVQALDLNIVAVQQLPCWTSSATRGVADLRKEDDGVCIIDERNIIAQIVTGKILGSGDSQSIRASLHIIRTSLTLGGCGCCYTQIDPLPGSKPAAQRHPTSAGRVPSVPGRDQILAPDLEWFRCQAPPPGWR